VVKKIFFWIFFAGTIACSLDAYNDARNLVILYTHDLHSNFKPFPVTENNTTFIVGGYARLATAIKHEQQGAGGAQNCVVVDAGDFTGGSLFQTIFPAYASEIITMGAMGYDVMTFGNHDFDFGHAGLASALHAAVKSKQKLPKFVASNMLIDNKNPLLNGFGHAYTTYPIVKTVVLERAGLKIGILGLLGVEAATYASDAAPIKFNNYIDVAQRIVTDLRQNKKVDVIICLSHAGLSKDGKFDEDRQLAQQVPGIDVIISAHKHAIIDEQEDTTFIVACGQYGRYLGRLEITCNADKTVSKVSNQRIPIDSKFVEDKHVAELIDSFEKKIDGDYLQRFGYAHNRILAYCPTPLDASNGLAQLVTDAFIYALKTVEGVNFIKPELTLEAYGHLRFYLPKGDITVADVLRVLPLGSGPDGTSGYPLVTFWLTGKEIKNLLEIETTISQDKSEMHLEINGMQLTYDPEAPRYHRVTKIDVETDKGLRPLDDDKQYRVCTSWHLLLIRDYLKKTSGGVINFTPKNDRKKVIAHLQTTCEMNGILELKEWFALALYLSNLPKDPLTHDGLATIPNSYQKPKARIFKVVKEKKEKQVS
jgi:2',3'-cyclic-nucleotide 2'-phosphodiesterase (5'-nucleotidase family)